MRHFDVETLTPGRWLNGGGATREIASQPETGEFGWRASIADIDRDGAFSVFPGVDRTLTLVAGNGVLLTSPGAFERLPAREGEPVAFSGDLDLSAELLDGACRVFNIMVRRGRWPCWWWWRSPSAPKPISPEPMEDFNRAYGQVFVPGRLTVGLMTPMAGQAGAQPSSRLRKPEALVEFQGATSYTRSRITSSSWACVGSVTGSCGRPKSLVRKRPSVIDWVIVQRPAEWANGPVITCRSARRPLPPMKSSPQSEEAGLLSRVQSQYGTETVASIRRRADSNSSRNLRCQGRKLGVMCATRSLPSPSAV